MFIDTKYMKYNYFFFKDFKDAQCAVHFRETGRQE